MVTIFMYYIVIEFRQSSFVSFFPIFSLWSFNYSEATDTPPTLEKFLYAFSSTYIHPDPPSDNVKQARSLSAYISTGIRPLRQSKRATASFTDHKSLPFSEEREKSL